MSTFLEVKNKKTMKKGKRQNLYEVNALRPVILECKCVSYEKSKSHKDEKDRHDACSSSASRHMSRKKQDKSSANVMVPCSPWWSWSLRTISMASPNETKSRNPLTLFYCKVPTVVFDIEVDALAGQ